MAITRTVLKNMNEAVQNSDGQTKLPARFPPSAHQHQQTVLSLPISPAGP